MCRTSTTSADAGTTSPVRHNVRPVRAASTACQTDTLEMSGRRSQLGWRYCQQEPRPDDVPMRSRGGGVRSTGGADDGAVLPAWRPPVAGLPWRTVVTTVRRQVVQSTAPRRLPEDVSTRRTLDVHTTPTRSMPQRPFTPTQVNSVVFTNTHSHQSRTVTLCTNPKTESLDNLPPNRNLPSTINPGQEPLITVHIGRKLCAVAITCMK